MGSLKANIGHLQAGSGIAGVIKMVLAMRHGILPRLLHLDEPTPHVDWSSGAVELLTDNQEWPETGHPRRAGVSSFGGSGTNAHVILEEAPEPDPDTPSGPDPEGEAVPSVFAAGGVMPWVVSGRGVEGLAGQAGRLAAFVESAGEDVRPEDLAWSLAATRAAFEHRAVILGTEIPQLADNLATMASDGTAPGAVSGSFDAVPDG
ncbi:ketoacyl-synthetase C-terminal extension domain-containing protein, partial [Streptomyces bungoensis]|uniref:ketoacyl-synthetase C-terminal extension domain-containing protein n=1 Tax=Streptomyces bungoensis TaxID=285568 RepID=UPI000AA839DD